MEPMTGDDITTIDRRAECGIALSGDFRACPAFN
jgi:hypothetical protein